MSFADVADEVTPAVVLVKSEKKMKLGSGDQNPDELFRRWFGMPNMPRGDQTQRGLGSGFIIDKKGTILTNNHVVEGADKITVVLNDGRSLPGKVLGTDPKTDIAVVQVKSDGDLPSVKLGDSDKLRVGEWVLAIGSPFGEELQHSVTAGIISAKGRSNVGLADYEDYLQTDAAINPGNSGGPLVNLRGEVIGINSAIASRTGGYQGIGFAIPISMAQRISEALVAHGKVTRAWLGVTIQEVTPDLAKGLDLSASEGILVSDLVKDGPADRAGVKSGDVILKMDGDPAGTRTQFRNRVSSHAPSDRVTLEVLRDGKRQTIGVKLEEMTDERVAAAAGRSESGDLGFEVANLSAALSAQYELESGTRGVVVTDVKDGSTADDAGIRVGDVIRSVNRKGVDSVSEFKSAVDSVAKDHPLVLQLKRNRQSFFVTLQRNA
jgi:serine protease Do